MDQRMIQKGKDSSFPNSRTSHWESSLKFHGVGHTTSNATRNWKDLQIGKKCVYFKIVFNFHSFSDSMLTRSFIRTAVADLEVDCS